MTRLRLIWHAIFPTLIVWAALLSTALLAETTWPTTGDGWLDLATFALIVEFVAIKALLMGRRMVGRDWLTVSLVAANVAFAVAYLWVIWSRWWPAWFAHETIRVGIRVALIVVLLWGVWMLVNVPEPGTGDDRLFLLADEHGVILFATAASEAMLGWPNGSLIGKPLTTIIPARFHERHYAGFRQWQATNEGPIFGKVLRVPVRKADGTETVVCLSISPAEGVGGRQAVATLIPGDQCPAVDLDLTGGQDR